MLTVETPVGVLKTLNHWTTTAHQWEVILDDCYRFHRLASVWTPRTMFDVGMNVGTASFFARSLWPALQIIGFEENAEWADIARQNVPDARVECVNIGHGLRGHDFCWRFGWPDLLKIDCEGGEVPFFYDLHRTGMLSNFRVIVGEWHWTPGRRLLEAAFADAFDTLFVDAPEGAGPWHYFFAVRRDAGLQDVAAKLLTPAIAAAKGG